MNLEGSVLNETSQRTNIVQFHLQEVPKRVAFSGMECRAEVTRVRRGEEDEALVSDEANVPIRHEKSWMVVIVT